MQAAYTYRENVLTSQKSEKNARRGYRFLYNGMEKDDEVYGDYNSYDFGARIYDPRIGRWLAVDPLAMRYVSYSPYSFGGNSPIYFMDPDGKKLYPGSKAEAKRMLSYFEKVFGPDIGFRYDPGSKTIAFDGTINHKDKSKEYLLKVVVEQIVNATDNDVHYKGSGGYPVGDNSVYVTENKQAWIEKAGLTEIEYDDEITYTVQEPSGKFVSTVFLGWDIVDRNVELENGASEFETNEMLFWHTLGHALGNKDLKVTSRSPIDDTRRVASRRAVGFENFVRKIMNKPQRTGNDHGVDKGDWGSSNYYFEKSKEHSKKEEDE